MQRFFIPSPEVKGGKIRIDDPRIVFQANKVLRMHAGDEFSVFDKTGKEVLVQVLEIDKHKVIGKVIKPIKRKTESDIAIALYQAIPKKPALFELVVQKATELGVSEIYPLITKRTEKHRLGKTERLNLIAMEAAEQCGRTRIPTIHQPIKFDQAIRDEHAYLAYENETKKTLTDFLPAIHKSKKANILIGPEGGFDKSEIDLAKKQGAHMFSLGPRILRTETAAIATLSNLTILQ